MLRLKKKRKGVGYAKARSKLLEVDTTVSTLDLGSKSIGSVGAQKLAELLKVNTTVITLDLDNNKIGNAGAQAIAQSLIDNTTVTTLGLHFNNIGNAGAQAIAELLKVNTTVTTLDLGNNKIGNAGAQELAESLKVNTTVTTLDLHFNDIGDVGTQELAESLKVNATVTTLDLGNNTIGYAGAQAIAEFLKVNTTVRILDLGNNKIGHAGTKALAESLKVNSTVTTLDLGSNHIGDAGAQALAESLKVNTTIATLDLIDNNISDVGAKALAELLKVNATVTTLYLESNTIGDVGAQVLAESLKVNTTIATLDLIDNNISDVGAKALAELLKVNATVTTLYLESNTIGDVGAQVLAESLKVNTTIATLDLLDNNISDVGEKALADAGPHWGWPDTEFDASIPTNILLRGPKALAAYKRALEFGKICDKRVKVLLIGRDRAGKTSLGRSLKGEPFNEEEPSTHGVEMSPPIKNAGTKAWKNLTSQQHTTAFDHKCAELIAKEVIDRSEEQHPTGEEPMIYTNANNLKSTVKQDIRSKDYRDPGSTGSKISDQRVSQENDTEPAVDNDSSTSPHPPEQNTSLVDCIPFERNSKERAVQIITTLVEDEDEIPHPIAKLAEEYYEEEGFWPVIWDFAGQAVYRAIHPIFMSPEAIYLLVIDLTKELSDIAECFVKQDGHDEEEVESPESEDTNLDHILRWMSLVHSLKQSAESIVLPSEVPSNSKYTQPQTCKSVIFVGTKADMVDGDPRQKLTKLRNNVARHSSEFTLRHITENSFVVDNTRAGKDFDQEDEQIGDLRENIITLANEMPHTKQEIPLQWLSVEQEIASQNEPYVSKKKFRSEIAKKCCSLNEGEDLEELLHFLHFRGTIIYHDRPEATDGLVVLNPKWLIKTICEIITAKPMWTYPLELQCHFDRLATSGILSKELLDLACAKLNIGDIKDSLIFVMKKFNLIFEWKVDDDNLIYLVPCMLKKFKEVKHTTKRSFPPLCLRFDNGGYVPTGLFSRLVVLFGVWASEQCTAEQPDLSSNAALFFVDEKCTLNLVCYSSVIKLYFSFEDDSGQMETSSYCVKILRQLEKSWKKLKTECHWLHSVSLTLCARCESCSSSGCGSKPCVRHGQQECTHDDCAHYLDLRKKPLACKIQRCHLPQSLKEKYKPWIEAIETVKSEELNANNIQVLQKMHCDADKVNTKSSLSDDLMKITSDKGFRVCENQASGNCLFYALSEQLEHVKGVEVSHGELREILVQFLRQNPNLVRSEWRFSL